MPALLALCMVPAHRIDAAGETKADPGSISFQDTETKQNVDLGKVESVRAQVVNGRCNVAVTLTSKVMLQLNGILCDGELEKGRRAGNEFRAILMHTPWGEAALVGEAAANHLDVSHVEPDQARISFVVVMEGLGRKISASGSFLTRRRSTPANLQSQVR
ncbi:MAG: hypothetical protein JNG86_04630 [Verrucomicrobiaceae bacterium]|nr:hypothetical protein [Verrucomicrobiaceae bacterium]